MDKKKYFNLIIDKGLNYELTGSIFIINNYKKINFSSEIISIFNDNIESKLDFEIPINLLNQFIEPLKGFISDLLTDPDFDPLKEELRLRYKEQYEGNVLTWNGAKYYLYTKGENFHIDSLIQNAIIFKELVEFHIEMDKILKFNYLE